MKIVIMLSLISASMLAISAPALAQVTVVGHEYHPGEVLRFEPLPGVDVFPAAQSLSDCTKRHGEGMGPQFDYSHAGVPTTYDGGKRTVIVRRGDIVTVVAMDKDADLEFRTQSGKTGACLDPSAFQVVKATPHAE